jgi:hypothetical protein
MSGAPNLDRIIEPSVKSIENLAAERFDPRVVLGHPAIIIAITPGEENLAG